MPSTVDTKPPEPPRQRKPLRDAMPPQGQLPADLVALVERGAQRASSEEQPASSHGFILKVKSPGDLAKTVLEILKAAGVVFAIVIGATNMATKAPVPDVAKVERRVEDVELRVDGKTDQKGASSEGESLSERVAKLESVVRPMAAGECAERQFLSQVMARLSPPVVIRVDGCSTPATPIAVTEEPPLPGRRGKGAIVVHTPYP